MPKISIIIATFNAAKFLKRALDSVLNQKLQDWECIIVDGVSRDETVAIIMDFAAKDPRFRWLSEPDNGIYDAFNKGWKLAKGEWIYYLGADDILLQDGLSGLLDECKDYNYDVIYGDTINLYENGKEIVVKHLNISAMPYRVPGGHQATLTKRKAIEELGGFDIRLKVAADKDLFIRLWKNKYLFHAVDNVSVAKFSYGGASTVSTHASLRDNISIYRKNRLSIKYPLIMAIRFMWSDIKKTFGLKISTH